MVVSGNGADGRIQPALARSNSSAPMAHDDQPDEPVLDLPRRLSRARSSAQSRVFADPRSPASSSADPPGAIAAARLRTSSATFDSSTCGLPTMPVDGTPVLNDFSRPRCCTAKSVALVGPSGAGKSTIVNLVPRFFDPAGRDGLRSTASTSRTVQASTTCAALLPIVPQETQLFNGTIADNIRYGRLDAPDDDEVLAAAHEANVDEFVDDLAGPATAPSSGSAVSASRAVSASGSPSPARSCATRAS